MEHDNGAVPADLREDPRDSGSDRRSQASLYATILEVDQRRPRGGDRRSDQFRPGAGLILGSAAETAKAVSTSARTVERVRAIADRAAAGDPTAQAAVLAGGVSIKAA